MSLRFHEISEGYHRVLNPVTLEQLMELSEAVMIKPGSRILDLCCGKGEMLCQWSARWQISGVGVDISKVFLSAANERSSEMGVADKINFIEMDAAKYRGDGSLFDIVSCIGATWIGNGLLGTLEIMKEHLAPGGLLLVGEPYWKKSPPEGVALEGFVSLGETHERIESAGWSLVELMGASDSSWDRYMAPQWLAVHDWLRENPDDPDHEALKGWIARGRKSYLDYERDCLGWAIFALKAAT